MAANDYRVYLRSPTEMENAQARFHSAPSAEPTCRPLVFGTLVVMGLLQILSSVAILLHLTGYLHEVRDNPTRSEAYHLETGLVEILYHVTAAFSHFEFKTEGSTF